MANGFINAFQAGQQTQANRLAMQQGQQERQSQVFQRMAQGVLSAPPEQQAQMYDVARQEAIRMGVPETELSQQWDDKTAARLRFYVGRPEPTDYEFFKSGVDLVRADPRTGEAMLAFEGRQAPATDPLAKLRAQAQAAGLQEGTEDYRKFMMQGGAPRNSRTVFGPDGTPVFHEGPAGSGLSPLREFDAKATSFGTRMAQSNPRLLEAESKLLEKGGPNLWNTLADQFGTLGNYAQSSEYQAYRAGSREWIAGLLRLDSGAAVPEPEFERYFATYFTVPGDSPEVIEQKRQARETVMEAVGRIAPAGRVPELQQQGGPQGEQSAPSFDLQSISDEDLLKALGR